MDMQSLVNLSTLKITLILSGIILIRYLALVAGFYFIVYRKSLKPGQRFFSKRISEKIAPLSIVKSEMGWSILSTGLFGWIGALGVRAWSLGYTAVYTDFSINGSIALGLVYFVLSLALALFFHDTYFYWVHRWMHRPFWYRLIHKVHHDSRTPTPWAAFSFHPFESLIEAIILPAIIFVIPLHPVAILILLVNMTLLGIINHLGVEIYSRGFAQGRFTRWLISATHHEVHHRFVAQNYGLYFTWWDHWCGTEDKKYSARYADVWAGRRMQ